VVAGPLLAPGLVLAVDLNFGPHPHLPGTYWGAPEATHELPPSRLPYDAAFVLLGKVGLVAVGEKALLLAVVLLAGLGMHRLVAARTTTARYFAGFLYAVNPFVYDRLWTGQWFLLLGYALVPWAFAAFLRALRGEREAAWRFAVIAFLIGAASPHIAVLLVVLCALTSVAERAVAPAVLSFALAAALSLFWLLPTPGVADFWRHVGHEQLAYYSTVADAKWGIGATVAGLYGFWNDPAPVKAHLSIWPVLAAALVGLALWGLALRARDRVAWAVASAGALGFLLALGTSSALTRGTFTWLLDHVNVLRSFREPEKGVALLAFAYAYLGVPAVDDLAAALRGPRARAAAAAALVALPLLYGYRELYGLWGSMRTSSFPRSWAEARRLLPGDARTLFLPWSGYLELDFAHDRLVGNPAPGYFSTPILASRSVSASPATREFTDPTQEDVSRLLANVRAPAFGACLAGLGVSRVLVASEPGAERYAGLASRRDLVRVRRWDNLTLYRVKAPAGIVMAAPPSAPRCTTSLKPLRAERVDPAHVRLLEAVPRGRRLVLGLPQRGSWTLHGRDLELRRWHVYERNYALGALAALLAALAAFVVSRRAAASRRASDARAAATRSARGAGTRM